MTALRVQQRSVAGAELLVVEDHSLPAIRFAVGLRGGARGDPDGRSGLTRVLLEMLLRGTEARPRTQFNTELEQMGSQLNAATGIELGLLRGCCLQRFVEPTLALAAEALATPRMATDEQESLVAELCSGLVAERDDDESLAELFLHTAFYGPGPIGRLPAGRVSELASITPKDLRDALARRLRAGELLLGFAGDVRMEQAERLAATLLQQLQGGAGQPLAVPTVACAEGLSITVVDKPDRTQAQLRVAAPGLRGDSPDIHAFLLGVVAFGGTFTSPFTREVRDSRGWSYTASASFNRWRGIPAPVVLRTAPALCDALDCLELELDLLSRLGSGQLEEGTAAFARDYLLNRFPFEVATAGDLLLPAMRSVLLGMPSDEVFRLPERLQAVDLSDVGPVMAKHLAADRATVVMVAPAERVVPALQQRFAQAAVQVVDYRDGLGKEAAEGVRSTGSAT